MNEQEMMNRIEALPFHIVLDSIRRCGGKKLAESGIVLENILFDSMAQAIKKENWLHGTRPARRETMVAAVYDDLGLA